MRAEVADSLMDVDSPVAFDDDQAVEAVGATHIRPRYGLHSSHFAALPLTVSSLPFLPVEELSASINDTPLTPDAENSVDLGNGPPELTVEVQKQGDSVEKDVVINYSISGGAVPIEGQQNIPSLDAQGIKEQPIGFETEPETDTPLTLRVEVLPVPGETVTDNNTFTYTVTFN